MFARAMCREEFGERGLLTDYVQQNISLSADKGTVRGMHYQRAPHTEAKLVRCTRGAIRDVIVDMRRSSATFLPHQGFELTQEHWHQLYLPPDFPHGFQPLSDDAEVTNIVSAAYSHEPEGGVVRPAR